ncbi:unnamed protein product [Symbiodinium sp. CCMP2456]|nr:unnamed protein product [Symbiodinium sp. CCMP2456]
MDILRAHKACALNTWGRPGLSNRTFLPPHSDSTKLGTQIDYVIAKGHMIDTVAKQSTAFDAPFVPTSGCRHRPILVSLPSPQRLTRGPMQSRLTAHQVGSVLKQPGFLEHLKQHTRQAQRDKEVSQPIDDLLLQGWRSAKAEHPGQSNAAGDQPGDQPNLDQPLTQYVRSMWTVRHKLRQLGQDLGRWSRGGPSARSILQAWLLTSKLQRHTRELRKACRWKKTLQVAEAVKASNIHQAAKRFTPKTPRRRLQLRDEHGHLQTHEAEFAQITEYFQLLYDGPSLSQNPTLTEDLNITAEEIMHAMARLKPNKAVPSVSAPAALWKQLSQVTVPILVAQFAQAFRKGATKVPEAWSISELILLPKPNKSLRTPAHLRPICLLPLQAKITASTLARRLLPFVSEYLRDQPQFAYVPDRTLAQALERALLMALREALVPENLVQAVLLIHEEAKLKVAHCGQEKLISLRRGLRQGCSLSPMLWSLYTGWLFRKMHQPEVLSITEHGTSYADDKHFSWVVRSGRDLEKAYAAIKHILTSLQELGLSISTEKTVILLELKGPQAAKAMARYTVMTQVGRCMRFNIAAKEVYIKLAAKHVYLGAVISYKSFEHETFQHRSRLAKGTFTRLGTVLKNRSVPVRLRLQLWRGCVWPTWLHGLDSVGLSVRDRQTLHTQLLIQARTIANSFSMITRESNLKFLQRHHLPDPVRRLQTSVTLRSNLDIKLGPRLRPTSELVGWRQVVQQQLLDPEANTWSQATPARNHGLCYLGESTQPSFDCDICGQSFGTQAALRSHVFRMHLDQQSKTERVEVVKQARNIPSMEHAKDGLPQCRHCLHSFTTWHAFFYHVQAQGCPGLRQFLNQAEIDPTLLPTLSEALIDSPTVLEAAKNSNWQDLARLDCVRNRLHTALSAITGVPNNSMFADTC